MGKRILIIFIIIIVLFLTACQSSQDNNKLTIAVSIVPEKTFVEAVGGDLVEVVTMIPPGNSPTNYAPSPKELMKLSEAVTYFSIGVPAEKINILPKIDDFNSKINIVHLHEEVKKVYPEREFSPGKRDPHIWLSPKRAKLMINMITRELTRQDKVHQVEYKKNAENYLQKLGQLDQEIQNSLRDLDNKTFLVYHPSFGYFAQDYGLDMLTIEKDGKKATPRRLEEIIDIAKKQNIKAIFYQSEVDNRQAQAIAEEIGGKTVKLDPLAANYIENLRKTTELFNSILN